MTDDPRPPLHVVDKPDPTRAATRVVVIALELDELIGGVPEPDVVASMLRAGAAALASCPSSSTDMVELLRRSHIVARTEQIADGIDAEVGRVKGNRIARQYDIGVRRRPRQRRPEPEPAS